MREFKVLSYLRKKGVNKTGLPYLTEEDWSMLRGIVGLPQNKTEKFVDEVVDNGWEYYVEDKLRRLERQIDEMEKAL